MEYFKKIWFSGILSFLFLSVYPVFAQEGPEFDRAWEETSGYFENILQNNNIVGGALVFMEDGKTKESNYFGLADISQNRQVDENTIFHWASITKTLTAIAIMQLRDRGLLNLNDPVTKYLPKLRQVHNPYGSMDDITIKMVMSHSSGFRSPTWPWGGGEKWHPFEPTKWSQVTAMFPYTKILFEPGSKYHYSNPAIIFLGQIIEIISGDPYEVYIDKNILKPLKMYSSYYDITPYHLVKFRSNNYTLKNGKPVANGLDFNTGITAANGGLNAPLKDMVKYLAFLTGDSKTEILKRSSLKEMWQALQKVGEVDGVKSAMGLSFFIEKFDNMKVIGHTGTQKAFYSFFYIHPPSHTAIIGITNTNSASGEPNLEQIRINLSHKAFRELFGLYGMK